MPKKSAKERAAERKLALALRFAAIYISNGRNATQAYLVLHPNVTVASAAVKGSQWLRIVSVEDEIARLTAESWKREHMTAEEVLGRIARIARQDIRDFYWRPGELDRHGNATLEGARKPLAELTDAQAECVKGFTYDREGRLVQELYAKDSQLATVAKHKKLLTDKVDLNLTVSLDKLLEQSYGDEK